MLNRSSLLGALVLLALAGPMACDQEAPTIKKQESLGPVPPLSREFLKRATKALDAHLKADSQLFELRATGDTFSVQLAPTAADKSSSALVQFDYLERPGTHGTAPTNEVIGPSKVEIEGKGKLEENLFSYKDIQLYRMARSFKVALLAVDPEEGTIERLVVRRFLPFSEGIRARIFVKSPRMNGSIDVNEKGLPLKR